MNDGGNGAKHKSVIKNSGATLHLTKEKLNKTKVTLTTITQKRLNTHNN
jgi:hypothetical protein